MTTHQDDRDRNITSVAASLMRMALALLDRAGESLAAARLQHALDTLERRTSDLPTEAELEQHAHGGRAGHHQHGA